MNKATGRDLVFCLLSCLVAFISCGMTNQLLEYNQEGQIINTLGFYRGAFIFLAPCAIEALDLITLKKDKEKILDVSGIIIGVASIILTGYLLYEIVIESNLLCIKIITYLIWMYPLNTAIRLIYNFLKTMKER